MHTTIIAIQCVIEIITGRCYALPTSDQSLNLVWRPKSEFGLGTKVLLNCHNCNLRMCIYVQILFSTIVYLRTYVLVYICTLQVEDLEEITGVKQHKTFSLGKGVKQHKTFSLGKGVKQQNAKNQQVLTSATKTVQVPEDAVNMGEGEGEMEMPSSEASDISRGTSEKVLKLNKSRPVLIDQPRPSTPELKGKSQWGTRHHLNLTTPVNNGFFSPSKRDPVQVNRTESISGKYRRDLKSRAPIFPSKQAHTINIPTLSFDEGLRDESNKKRVVHKLPTDGRRPGGQATRRKGETLKELYMEETEDGMMCNICGADLDQSKLVSKNCKRGSALHKKADIYRNGGSPLLRMPEQDQSKPADWDTLSSISASSCSVASEILERAKIRKEKFWQE